MTVSGGRNRSVLFVCWAFPKRSEIAIFNQVKGVALTGAKVEVLSEGSDPEAGELLESIMDDIVIRRTPQRPLTCHKGWLANRLRLLCSGLRMMIGGFRRNPVLTLRSLDVLNHWKHARSFRLLYQVQPFVQLKVPVEYDVIHAQYGPNGTKAVVLRDIGAIRGPVVTSFRGYDINVLPGQEGKDLYHLLFTRGDRFTTDSGAMKSKLIELGCLGDRIDIIPSSIDEEFWSQCHRQPGDEDELHIVIAARLVPCKGIDIALNAIDILQRSNPGTAVKLSIAGDGPELAMLKQLSASKGRENVTFHGWMSQESLRKLFETQDVFVLPSIKSERGDEESQGLVLQEAQAAGLPVIASRLGGIPEGLVEGETGFLFEPGNPEDLARVLKDFCCRRKDWPQMNRAARQYATSKFSRDALTGLLEGTYDSLTMQSR